MMERQEAVGQGPESLGATAGERSREPPRFDPLRLLRQHPVAAAVFLIVVISARFLFPEADFPFGISSSNAVFTDEGWYANAAIRSFTYGYWYLPGDFNPAVNLPGGQFVHWLVFKALGVSLASARLSAGAAEAAIVLMVGAIVRRHHDGPTALLAMLFMACNFSFFAFSHLTTMEPLGIFFVTVALATTLTAPDRFSPARAVGAGLAVGAAILVKSSMSFSLPVVAYAIWSRPFGRPMRLLEIALTLGIAVGIGAAWQLFALKAFSADYTYFVTMTIADRQVANPLQWLLNLVRTTARTVQLGPAAIGLTGLALSGLLLRRGSFFQDRLVRVCLLYAAAHLGSLSLITYAPTRYYLPLIVPLSVMAAIACHAFGRTLTRSPRQPWRALLPGLAALLIMALGIVQIAWYLSHRAYSFAAMARDVGRLVGAENHGTPGPLVLGEFADSVSLVVPIRAVNSLIRTSTLPENITRYSPGFALTHGDEERVRAAFTALGRSTTQIGEWTVFQGRYHGGAPVKLFRVDGAP